MQNRQGKLKIFHRFIFDKINMCRKKLDNKKINLIKNSKKLHFSKEVSPWFSSKIWKAGEKNVFDDILHRKTAFLD